MHGIIVLDKNLGQDKLMFYKIWNALSLLNLGQLHSCFLVNFSYTLIFFFHETPL